MIMSFAPIATTLKLSPTTTSANGAMAQGGDVRVHNAGTTLAFIKWSGTASPTATTSDYPLPAGAVEVLQVGTSKYVAAVFASGTGDIYFTPGRGI